jgi:hypothetical protein
MHESCTIWICTDCLVLLANGETPPDMTEDETEAWVAGMVPARVTLGMMTEEHATDCPNVASVPSRALPRGGSRVATRGQRRRFLRSLRTDRPRVWLGTDDCYCEHDAFSWSRCDNCRRPNNAGERHAATYWFAV